MVTDRLNGRTDDFSAISATFGGQFFGGDSNDNISDSWGTDTISGGSGDDYISQTAGNDVIDGGEGTDTLSLDAYALLTNLTIIGIEQLNVPASLSTTDVELKQFDVIRTSRYR